MNKFTQHDLQKAIGDLGMCEFFPTDPGVQAAVMNLLAKMCPSREALAWLMDTMVNRVGKWHGPKELRGVLCTRYPPADSIEATSSIAGFTPEDGYAQSLAEHEQLKAGGWWTPPALEEDRALVLQITEGKSWPTTKKGRVA